MYRNIRNISERSASLLLLLLLSSDIAFNVLHIVQHSLVPYSSPVYTRLTEYLLIYHLIKQFWIIVLFAYLVKLTRFWGYISWLILFIYFLFDDAFEIHQHLGSQLINTLNISLLSNLRHQHRLTELATLAIVSFILLAFVAWAYFHGSSEFKKISNDLLIFLVALVFFGLIADLAAALNLRPTVILGMIIIEDGGEMVTLSLFLWYVFLVVLRDGKPDHFLLDPLSKS